MDGLTQKITQGDAAALNLVKSALSTPTLINTDITQGTLYALGLECETFQQGGTAQVSESLLVIKNGKKNISDNVAPGSWTWELSGYIPGNKLMEPTNYYTPFVKLNTDILMQWFKKGAVLRFKDMDARLHLKVVIQSLRVSHVKDCRNYTPFTMTLKEINTIERQDDLERTDAQKTMAAVGSALGQAAKGGVILAASLNLGTTQAGNIMTKLGVKIA